MPWTIKGAAEALRKYFGARTLYAALDRNNTELTTASNYARVCRSRHRRGTSQKTPPTTAVRRRPMRTSPSLPRTPPTRRDRCRRTSPSTMLPPGGNQIVRDAITITGVAARTGARSERRWHRSHHGCLTMSIFIPGSGKPGTATASDPITVGASIPAPSNANKKKLYATSGSSDDGLTTPPHYEREGEVSVFEMRSDYLGADREGFATIDYPARSVHGSPSHHGGALFPRPVGIIGIVLEFNSSTSDTLFVEARTDGDGLLRNHNDEINIRYRTKGHIESGRSRQP